MRPVPLTVYKDGRMKNESEQHVRIRWGTLWWILVCQWIFSLFSGVVGAGRKMEGEKVGWKQEGWKGWREGHSCGGTSVSVLFLPLVLRTERRLNEKASDVPLCQTARTLILFIWTQRRDTSAPAGAQVITNTWETCINTVNSISFLNDDELKQKGIKIYQIDLFYIDI